MNDYEGNQFRQLEQAKAAMYLAQQQNGAAVDPGTQTPILLALAERLSVLAARLQDTNTSLRDFRGSVLGEFDPVPPPSPAPSTATVQAPRSISDRIGEALTFLQSEVENADRQVRRVRSLG